MYTCLGNRWNDWVFGGFYRILEISPIFRLYMPANIPQAFQYKAPFLRQQIEPHLNSSLPVNYHVIQAVFQEYLIVTVAVDNGCHMLLDVLLQRGCLIRNALPRFHGV